MSQTVYVCEKPSQAEDVAKALGLVRKERGHYVVKNDTAVTWAIGNLFELAMPDVLDPKWKRWSWDALPIIPTKWQDLPVTGTKPQLEHIRALLKEAKTAVIATDAGREGELIGRKILEYAKFKGRVLRLWTSSLAQADLAIALKKLQPESVTRPLYHAALARQRADYLYGLTLTRAGTLGHGIPREVFPSGRVQTPTLGLVVDRHEDFIAFKPRPYFELEVAVHTDTGGELMMVFAPAEDDRIFSKEEILRIAELLKNGEGFVKLTKSARQDQAPLPFSLPALQQAANKTYKLSAKDTLAAAQALYDAKYLTYPRTDCRYLATSQKLEVPEVLRAVGAVDATKVAKLTALGLVLRPELFDDTKLTDHHAIIPTQEVPRFGSAVQEQVYRLVAMQYLRALAPPHVYDVASAALQVNEIPLRAEHKRVTQEGWKALG